MSAAGDWWRSAVIYEIYPRSFCDSNGDGIGDLDGIARRLEHVAELGADAVWIAPFFASPMKDFGYDVADYRAVDPLFGDLAAFDRMLRRAHDLGLKVIIDQVWSHTSDRHPWFLESCDGAEGGKAEWYCWAPPKPDGSPPNNWQSVFGGPAWRWDPRRRACYLHHFLSQQPKLNLRCPEVLDAVLDTGRFWLERGVDGFRLDALDFMVHDPSLADNPARPLHGGPLPVKPFGLQEHIHDVGHSDTLAVIAAIRGLMDRFPGTTTVGEVSSEPGALDRCDRYTAGTTRLHMAYTLRTTRHRYNAAETAANIAGAAAALRDGWLCWSFSNHDVERVASRWGGSHPDAVRQIMALLLCQKGAVSVYQGEELGLPEAELHWHELQDPYGINFWPKFKGRDGCRTPMPWQAGASHGGFTTGRPWLPVPEAHRALAVDVQERDPGSMLNAWRRFLAWRKTQPALLGGDLSPVPAPAGMVAFERRCATQALLCVFNLDHQGSAAFDLAPGWRATNGHGFTWSESGGRVVLPRHGVGLFEGVEHRA